MFTSPPSGEISEILLLFMCNHLMLVASLIADMSVMLLFDTSTDIRFGAFAKAEMSERLLLAAEKWVRLWNEATKEMSAIEPGSSCVPSVS